MKITRRQLRQLIEAAVELSDEEIKDIEDSEKEAIKKIADAGRGVVEKEVKLAYKKSKEEEGLSEELERLSYASKEQGFTYGLDYFSKKDKAADDIIGHTWLTHVKRKGSALNEIGEVLWHSLRENGEINLYDVEWPDGTVETNISANLLEKVKDSSEGVHEAHGVKGHEEDLMVSERKYKKKSKKKKKPKKKSKKRNTYKVFPYMYGGGYYHDHKDDSGDYESGSGFDGFGDGAGGE